VATQDDVVIGGGGGNDQVVREAVYGGGKRKLKTERKSRTRASQERRISLVYDMQDDVPSDSGKKWKENSETEKRQRRSVL